MAGLCRDSFSLRYLGGFVFFSVAIREGFIQFQIMSKLVSVDMKWNVLQYNQPALLRCRKSEDYGTCSMTRLHVPGPVSRLISTYIPTDYWLTDWLVVASALYAAAQPNTHVRDDVANLRTFPVWLASWLHPRLQAREWQYCWYLHSSRTAGLSSFLSSESSSSSLSLSHRISRIHPCTVLRGNCNLSYWWPWLAPVRHRIVVSKPEKDSGQMRWWFS